MKKKVLILTALCLTCSVTLVGCTSLYKANRCDIVIGSHSAVTPAPRPKVGWWMPRHQAVLERVKQGNVDLLMIGDSITHGWDRPNGTDVWNKYYAHRNAVNLGFGGDRTQQVLWRLENGEIDNINPKLAVLMIGTNNSNGKDNTAEEIADGIKAIICKLRSELPQTKVLILAIFPRGNFKQATPNAQQAKNSKASEIASKMADNKMIFYLDINKAFLNEDGVLTKEIMPDLLHPNKLGYEKWAEAMEPMIVKLMGGKK